MIVSSEGTEIQLKTDANYEALVKLSGISLNLKIHWNDWEELWVLSMYNASGVALFEGQPLIFHTNLLYHWRGFGVPKGALILFDNTNSQEKPTRDGIPNYRLMFFPEVL